LADFCSLRIFRTCSIRSRLMMAPGNPVTGNTIDLLLTHPTASAKRWRVVDAMGRETGTGVFTTDA
jgi:hypothetical protein